ncbi:DNA pilot protein [Microviridae sp.]|nr:DNA pilot protein [Microviridae sp.]
MSAGFWTGAGGGLVGGGLGLIGQGISAGISQANASKSWDRQKNLITRGPTYQMTGLRAAGLNPILAVKNIGNVSGQVQMARAPDFGGAMAQGASAATSALKNPEEIRLRGKQADAASASEALTRGAANVAGEEAKNKRAQNLLIKAQAARELEAARAQAHQADILGSQKIGHQVDRRINESEAEYYRRQAERWIGTASDGIRLFTQPFRDIVNTRPETTTTETYDRSTDVKRGPDGKIQGTRDRSNSRSHQTTKRKR